RRESPTAAGRVDGRCAESNPIPIRTDGRRDPWWPRRAAAPMNGRAIAASCPHAILPVRCASSPTRESGTAESGPVVSEQVRSNAEAIKSIEQIQPTRFETVVGFFFGLTMTQIDVGILGATGMVGQQF